MTDAETVALARELGKVSGSIDALHRRFDEWIAREAQERQEALDTHQSLDKRVGKIESWKSYVAGIAIGIAAGTGGLAGWIAQELTNNGG